MKDAERLPLPQHASSDSIAPHRRTLLPDINGAIDAPDEQTANAYTVIAADPAVRKLAMRCRNDCAALIRQGGYEHFLTSAVMGAATFGCSPLQWLEQELELIRAEAAQVKIERARATVRRKEARDKLGPLSAEVARRSTSDTTERLALLERVRLSDRARESTWSTLRAVGLTQAEIEAKGVEPTMATVERWKARISVIDRELKAFTTWSADPLRNVEALRGVPGFEQYLPAPTRAQPEHA